MPQPAANDEAAQALIDVYRQAHESITARIMESFPPGQAPAQRRLRELLASVDAEIAALQAETKAWVEGTLPSIYQTGGQVAAAAAGTDFTWTQAHLEAVQQLAQRTFDGLLEATQFVADDTKQTIRAMARSETRRALLESVTATKAGADMAKQVTAATGAVTVRYANGARHSVADHADTVLRTETAQAYNEGTFVQAREDGFDWMEVFDGPDCGWTRHDDPDKADGSVRSRADCEAHPISHPRCVMPGTRIEVHGRLVEIVRARFSGCSYTIRWATSAGSDEVTVGPHHPVLTRRGWVPAHLVCEGDDLVRYRRLDDSGHVGLEPDFDQMPTVEEVFEASRVLCGYMRVAASSDDLHGDAVFCEGEIEVVRPARSLLVVPDARCVEVPGEDDLVGADAGLALVAEPGGRDSFVEGVAAESARGVCGVEHGGALLVCGAGPVEPSSFLMAPAHAESSDHLADRGGLDAESFGDDGAAQLLVDVHAPYHIGVEGASAALGAVDLDGLPPLGGQGDVGAAPMAGPGGPVGSGDVGHGWLRVVAVDVGWHDGWAYDLTTTGGTFGSMGCTLRNCARSFAPAVDVTSQAEAKAASRFTPAEQAARSAAEQARVDAAVPKFTVAQAEAKAAGRRAPRRAARPSRASRPTRARRS